MSYCLKILLLFSMLTFSSVLLTETPLAPNGLQYLELTTPNNQIVHIIDVDPAELDIITVHANEEAHGLSVLPDIAKHHKAIAAINGSFFKMNGLPAGILKIQKDWYGIAYRSRGAIGWSNIPSITLMDRLQTKTNVYLNHQKFPVKALNQPLSNHQAVLYTDVYGKEISELPDSVSFTITSNAITQVHTSEATPLPKNSYVYALGPKAKHPKSIEIGAPATVNIEVIPHFLKEHHLEWQKVDNIVGGAPLLIFQGKPITDYSAEHLSARYLQERYARTAVGLLKNKHWLLVIVEQSALTGSPGMTIAELRDFLMEQGCEYALNLDGGGSSTLFINNKVVNHPEGDDDEDYGWRAIRPIGNAILVVPKKSAES